MPATETSGTEQGSTAGTDTTQEQGSTGGTGQEQGSGQQQDQQTSADTYTAPDYSSIEDEALRTSLLEKDRQAWENGRKAARYRTERNSAREEAKAAKLANETEAERVKREAQEEKAEATRLREENRDLKVGSALRTAARDAHNVDLVVDLLGSKVELDDDGKPTNVPALLTDLRRTSPFLFKVQGNDAGAGAGGDGSPTTDMNTRLREALSGRRSR